MLRSGEDDGEEDDEVFALLPLDDDVFKFKDVELTTQECSCAVHHIVAEMMSENPSRRSNVSKRISFRSISCCCCCCMFCTLVCTKEK